MSGDELRSESDQEQAFVDRHHFTVDLPRSLGDWRCEICRQPIRGRVFGAHTWEAKDTPWGESAEYYGCICWACLDSIEYSLATGPTPYEDVIGGFALPYNWPDEECLDRLLELRITPWGLGEVYNIPW